MDLESICMTLRGIEPLSPGLESGVMPLYDKIYVFIYSSKKNNGGTRTRNLQIRNLTHYPIVLRCIKSMLGLEPRISRFVDERLLQLGHIDSTSDGI